MTEIARLLDRRDGPRRDAVLRDGRGDGDRRSPTSASGMSDGEQIDLVALDLPTTSFSTQALWYELGDDVLGELPMDVLLGSLHAAEHSQIAVLPLLAMCDRWDIGGLSTNLHPQTGGPTIFIYDGHPGGIGITRRGFLMFESLVGDAHRLVQRVPVQGRLPVLRPVAQVRQPQRAAAQGGLRRGHGHACCGLCELAHEPVHRW